MSKLNILNELSMLSNMIFIDSKSFPDYEKYGLRSHLLRAIISVRLNIREGNVFGNKNKKRFFMIAKGSLEEAQECLCIANEWKYIDDITLDTLMNQYWKCNNMLNKLIQSICSNTQKQGK